MGLAIFGVVTLLFALLMFRAPYFRVANWPHAGIGLFLMGVTLITAPAAGSLLNRSGAVRALGVVLALVVALTAFAGFVAFFWVPRSLRHRFGEWDAIAAHPWLRRGQRDMPDGDR